MEKAIHFLRTVADRIAVEQRLGRPLSATDEQLLIAAGQDGISEGFDAGGLVARPLPPVVVSSSALGLELADAEEGQCVAVGGGSSSVVGGAMLPLPIDIGLIEGSMGDVPLGMLQIDTQNAYNSLSRVGIFQQLRVHFPTMVPLFRWVYGKATPIYSYHGKFICSCGTGVRQGDPLAGFFYCLATHVIEERLLLAFPSVDLVAFIDDQTVTGPINELNKFFKALKEAMLTVGLRVNAQKCQLFTSRVGQEWLDSRLDAEEDANHLSTINVSLDGLKILGTFLGTKEYVTAGSTLALRDYARIVPILPHFGNAAAFTLVQQCIKARPLYLMRVTEPWHIQEGMMEFDGSLTRMISRLMDGGLTDEDIFTEQEVSKLVLSLPVKAGGCGVRLGQHIIAAAYTASFFGAIPFIQQAHATAFRWLQHSSPHGGAAEEAMPMSMLMGSSSTTSSIGGSTLTPPLTLAVDRRGIGDRNTITASEGSSRGFFGSGLNQWAQNNITSVQDMIQLRVHSPLLKISQQNLTSIVDKGLVESVITQLQVSHRLDYLAWFRSNKADRGTGAWLGCGAFGSELRHGALTDEQFGFNLKLRLLIPLFSPLVSPTLRCGCRPDNVSAFDITMDNYHFLSCDLVKNHRGRRHSLLNLYLREASHGLTKGVVSAGESVLPAFIDGEPMKKNPEGADLRADFRLLINGIVKLVDCGVTSPTTVGNKAQASKLALHAAMKYERLKKVKYSNSYFPLVSDSVVPFIVEATGALGPGAMQFRRFLMGNIPRGNAASQEEMPWVWRWFIRKLSVLFAQTNYTLFMAAQLNLSE
jgi:hypothetical protein